MGCDTVDVYGNLNLGINASNDILGSTSQLDTRFMGLLNMGIRGAAIATGIGYCKSRNKRIRLFRLFSYRQ